MRRIRRSLAAAIGLILGFLAVLTLSTPLLAQTGSDTLDIFKNLSPDQQESIMQASGVGSGSVVAGSGGEPAEAPATGSTAPIRRTRARGTIGRTPLPRASRSKWRPASQ